MSEGTRRVFLSKSGAGAAAVGLVALTPAVAASSGSPTSPAALDTSSLTGSLVAFIDDVRAGTISLMVGEEEILVEDKELVARLVRAAAL